MAASTLPSPPSSSSVNILAITAALLVILLAPYPPTAAAAASSCEPIKASDKDQIQFALNLEFLEAELFLHAAHGYGLDEVAPEYALGGPPPVGAQKANLGPVVWRIIDEFGFQEVGHLRAILETVGGVPRPLYDLSAGTFGVIFEEAVGGFFGARVLDPPFDPYLCETNFLLACYLIPYVGLNGYVGTIPNLAKYTTRRLAAGLLGVEGGQDAVFRSLLYERADEQVQPYNITVAEFTIALSQLRNRLGMCGLKDEGLFVPPELGAENRTESNVLSLDFNSLAYPRTPPEILRIVYGTGNEHKPGGFLPRGGTGKIALDLLEAGNC